MVTKKNENTKHYIHDSILHKSDHEAKIIQTKNLQHKFRLID
jgi:hypothetical protein